MRSMRDDDAPRPRLVERGAPFREHPILVDRAVIGRGSEADVRVEHEDVSRRHAEVQVLGDGLAVRDLESKNGVYLNGARITGEAIAGPGDVLGLGRVELEVVHPAALVHRALLDAGEPTVTRMVTPSQPPAERAPGLVLPLLGVALFAALLLALLLL